MKKKVKGLIKNSVLLMLSFCILSTTGCVGMALRSITTGPTYAKGKHTLPDVASDRGRLFVYLVDGGPNLMNTMGRNNACTVDRQMYGIAGKSYWLVDLEPGHHKVTANGVKGWGFNARYGKYAVEFDLEQGEKKYCRIDIDGFGSFIHWKPIMVEASVAEQEMLPLPLNKDIKRKMTVPE